MPISAELYEQVALADPEGLWELYDGCLVSKPAMTTEHNRTQDRLVRSLHRQLDENEYEVRFNSARTRRLTRSYFIPDVFVVPVALVLPRLGQRNSLEAYTEPLPLVVEIWSPSTGGYDVETKFPEYQRRGDKEIWRIHPFECTLTAWRLQPNGSYVESLHTDGVIEPIALPGVRISIESLFG